MLGDDVRAMELDEETLGRMRRIFGDDHPHTLGLAANLATDLYSLGEFEQGCELDEDTLARRRRVLGDDHPDTRRSAKNLVWGLEALGRQAEADRVRQEFSQEF
jgi:hypothetical protein